MKLVLDPKAVQHFTSKVASLTLGVMPTTHSIPRDEFVSQRFIHGPIDMKDASSVSPLILSDVNGNEVSRYRMFDAVPLGLGGSEHEEFIRVCYNLSRIRQIAETVSPDTIKRIVFDFLFLRESGNCESFCHYLSSEIEKAVKLFEIWIPIYGCELESELHFGKVKFSPITQDFFDRTIDQITQGKSKEQTAKMVGMLNEERRETQGFMCGVVSIEAEADLAINIALEEVDKCLSLLRVFEPSMIIPSRVSQCTLYGRHHIRSNRYYIVENNVMINVGAGLIDLPITWRISNRDVEQMKQFGLTTLVQIASTDSPTEFEKHLSNILVMYTKSSLAHSVSDRILYLMTALECLLLFNDSEPIMHAVGERMAFMIEQRADSRMNVVKNCKKVYAIRSRYVHHGSSMPHNEMEHLTEFTLNVFRLMLTMIKLTTTVKTKEQLRTLIEEMKYR